jgi:hypothetical protein
MTPEKYAALLHGGNLDDWQNSRRTPTRRSSSGGP